jgi:hypothetical protein
MMPKSPKPPGIPSSPRTKGNKAASLRDLTRKHPSDAERAALRAVFFDGNPLVTAILGQTMVEIEVDELLRERLKHRDDHTWKLMTEERGPFSTFHAKIIAGRAMGLFDETAVDHLNRIRVIRNAFAHSKVVISFETDQVRNELKNIAIPTKLRSERYKDVKYVLSLEESFPRQAYVGLCVVAYTDIMKTSIRSYKATARNFVRSKRKREANALADALNALGESPNNFLKHFLDDHSADPKSQGLAGPGRVFRGAISSPDDNEDK